MNSTDKIRIRTVQNLLKLIDHHLEAMQRDVHGLEYPHWKEEVDGLWRKMFGKINLMSDSPQQAALELIRDDWTSYVTHYVGISR